MTGMVVHAMFVTDEPLTETKVNAVRDAWPGEDEFFKAVVADEPGVLVLEFEVDLDEGRPSTTFAAARRVVLDVTERVGLHGRVRALTGEADGVTWREFPQHP